jgi:hypothetical protein
VTRSGLCRSGEVGGARVGGTGTRQSRLERGAEEFGSERMQVGLR